MKEVKQKKRARQWNKKKAVESREIIYSVTGHQENNLNPVKQVCVKP